MLGEGIKSTVRWLNLLLLSHDTKRLSPRLSRPRVGGPVYCPTTEPGESTVLRPLSELSRDQSL